MIFDIFSIILYSIITSVILSLLLLYTIKKTIPELIENEKEYVKSDLENWVNSPKGREAIFLIGGLAANGMKTGLGVTGRGGKFKLEDVVTQLLAKIFTDKIVPNLGNPLGNQPQIGNQPQTAVNKNIQPFKSKY